MASRLAPGTTVVADVELGISSDVAGVALDTPAETHLDLVDRVL